MEIQERNGRHYIVIQDPPDPNNPDVTNIRDIDVQALASWSELLGIEDLEEVLEAIIEVQDRVEPEPDPVTGDNVWTDPYTLLSAREQAREQEARRALEEGTQEDPRSPLLRASLAAYNVVHQPIDGGECAMDRCRRAARERLGIAWEPSKRTGPASRLMTHTPPTGRSGSRLEGLRDVVELYRREFLHDLAGGGENPLRDTTPLEPAYTVEEDDPFAATMRKYGG